MWSGKSSALLAAIDRYRHQGRRVHVLKAAIDDRYATGSIVTHMGWKIDAEPVSDGSAVLASVLAVPGVLDVVALDEMFMVPRSGEALIELYRNGISIAVSTLDMSFQGRPFREVEVVLPWATRIEKLAAVCSACKADARYTWKNGGSGDEIEVGGSEKYEPRCMTCHPTINGRSR
jgi:thymidine kinase